MCMIFKCSDDTAEFGWELVNNFITAAGSSLRAGCSLITRAKHTVWSLHLRVIYEAQRNVQVAFCQQLLTLQYGSGGEDK